METENETRKEKPETNGSFEDKKMKSLNKFFMRNVILGLLFSLLLFVLTVGLLVFVIMIGEIDMAVKVTIISMIATFVLTTSKTLIDRTIELVTYVIRLLGEEQRGLSKKLGIEVEEVEFGSLNEEDKKGGS